MTGQYGQGADNILEAVIITPDGKVLTANEYHNTDIFWAIRGGGAGTYGIIMNLTVKAYPMPGLTMGAFTLTAVNGTSTKSWWRLIAKVHGLFPDMQDQGVHGYYTMSGPPSSASLTLSGSLLLWNGANGTFENATRPIQELVEGSNSTATVSLTKLPLTSLDQLLQWLPETGSVGTAKTIWASRLITRRTVLENQDLLAETLEKVGPQAVAPSVSRILLSRDGLSFG